MVKSYQTLRLQRATGSLRGEERNSKEKNFRREITIESFERLLECDVLLRSLYNILHCYIPFGPR